MSNPVGRPPGPPKTWSLPAINTVSTSLQREAAMMRVVSRNFVGKGERAQELRDALINKSYELDRFADSLRILP